MLDLLLIIAPYYLAKVYVRNSFVKYLVFISIVARQCIALVNSFPGVELIGSGADARRFLSDATQLVWQPAREFPVWLTDGYSIFVYLLRTVNKSSELLVQIFNPELTLQLLNIFIFIVSIVLIEAKFGHRHYDSIAKLTFLFVFFYPFSLTFNTFVLRESFQLLLISLTITLYDFPFHLTPRKIISIILILFAAPAFHFTYPFPILISITCYALLTGINFSKISISLLVFVFLAPLLLAIGYKWIASSLIANISNELSLISAQDIFLDGAIKTNELDQTRTYYFTSGQNLLLLPLYYRWRPFLYEVKTLFDFSLFFSNLIVSFCYFKALNALCRRGKILNDQQKLIILSILTIMPYDLFWSLGTVNWGTSARHSTAATLIVLMLFSHYRALQKPYPVK